MEFACIVEEHYMSSYRDYNAEAIEERKNREDNQFKIQQITTLLGDEKLARALVYLKVPVSVVSDQDGTWMNFKR